MHWLHVHGMCVGHARACSLRDMGEGLVLCKRCHSSLQSSSITCRQKIPSSACKFRVDRNRMGYVKAAIVSVAVILAVLAVVDQGEAQRCVTS